MTTWVPFRAWRSFVYFVLVRLVGVFTGRGSVSQLQLENVVLRHQLRVLRRTVRRPELNHRDRAFLAAASRALVALWVNFHDTEGEQILAEKWVQRSFEPEVVSGWTLTKLSDNHIGFATAGGFSANSAPLDIPSGPGSTSRLAGGGIRSRSS